jgi:hypothetical protein
MTLEEVISQILFWSIGIFSAVIAWSFYKSVNGRLRILMIRLFCCKVWLYVGAALWFLIIYKHTTISFVYIRIVLTLPMAITMFHIYRFIRIRK